MYLVCPLCTYNRPRASKQDHVITDPHGNFVQFLKGITYAMVGNKKRQHGEILLKALSHFGTVRVPRDRVKQIFGWHASNCQHDKVADNIIFMETRADPGELLAGLEASINIFHGTTKSTSTSNTKRIEQYQDD